MRSALHLVALLMLVAACPSAARADLYSDFVKSLEWLIDANEVIVVVEVDQRDGRKFARVEAVMKNAGDRKLGGWPGPDLNKLAAELPVGRRLLVFGRRGKDNVPFVNGLICLNEKPLAQGELEGTPHWKAATGSRDEGALQGVCAVIRRDGSLLTRADAMLDMVKQRTLRGSRVPADCNLERVERPYGNDEYGGRWRAGSVCDTREVCYSVLGPWEAEDAKGMIESLPKLKGWPKAAVARNLANFGTPEAIAALKACLDDEFVEKEMEDGVVALRRPVRAAALEALRRLGVEIAPRPE